MSYLEGNMQLKQLVGSGDRIMLLVLPVLVLGVILNILFPSFFAVGGPPSLLAAVSVIVLVLGIAIWAWSAVLILIRVPRKQLITDGPYSIVKHPLYTGVAFLVLPWVGFLLNTWLGVLIGAALYVGSRLYSPREEQMLAEAHGTAWDEYSRNVKIPWL
jgi:protein-S-isoprenylcysteine O-methyltransferase Ste14